uniref:Uncharacterized protein n=1 Tax=Arundo donax TaxID=35708 RepID=A0A0A9AIW9_ARUDO
MIVISSKKSAKHLKRSKFNTSYFLIPKAYSRSYSCYPFTKY